MIIKAKVVWEETITLDLEPNLSAREAAEEVISRATNIMIARDINPPKITHCIERPDIVDKETKE